MTKGRLGTAAACLLSSALVLVTLSMGLPGVEARAQSNRPPNVVVIMTDDQRWDTLWAMPNVGELLAQHGVSFTEAFVSNSWCCPSRATLLTGQYSHTNNVWTNGGAYGGFSSFEDSSTLATWLDGAGYRTALVGKYFNGYKATAYVPPGWDRWVAFTGAADYYGYSLSIDGALRTYGTAADYSTDVLADEAAGFIGEVNPSEPLFLLFTPFAPHTPATPARRHLQAFSTLPDHRPPSFNEADVSDKPGHIRSLPLLSNTGIKGFRRKQYRSLLAVDEAVAKVVTALEDAHRLSETLIVFTSDNGFLWGEHRWRGKQVPYEESIRVPLVIRYDPSGTSGTNAHMALNVDNAATIADIAGISAPGIEGRSLAPLLAGRSPDPEWRTDILIEHLKGTDKLLSAPSYCAVRDARYLSAVYQNGGRELYDLAVDPYQLVNKAGDATYAGTIARLDERLRAMCDPPPPGFTLP